MMHIQLYWETGGHSLRECLFCLSRGRRLKITDVPGHSFSHSYAHVFSDFSLTVSIGALLTALNSRSTAYDAVSRGAILF